MPDNIMNITFLHPFSIEHRMACQASVHAILSLALVSQHDVCMGVTLSQHKSDWIP